MANLDDAYAALRNADASGDTEGARKLAAYIQSQSAGAQEPVKQGDSKLDMLKNWAAGGLSGAGQIGATLVAPYDMAKDALNGKGLSLESNRARRADMNTALTSMGANTDSGLFQAGKLATEIGGTLGVGPALGGLAATAGAPAAVVNALTTGGMKAGETPGLLNMLTRIGGGAVTGGASAGLIDPSQAGLGAAIGGAAPPLLSGAGKVAGYAGRNINALVQPFTESGQNAITQGIIRKFAAEGPTALNLKQLVPGSSPTLAEATGNAGLARLQSTVRDAVPSSNNAFAERAAQNAAARNAALDDVAGDVGKLDFFKAERSEAGKQLYGKALEQGIDEAAMTPYVKGQVTQLLQRPSIQKAQQRAIELAQEEGIKLTDANSLKGLHYTKLALDEQIGKAASQPGQENAARLLMATKDKLDTVMTKLSPAYKEANVTFAEMSKPVNQMEVLQGLRLTDATGNITLSKIQNAIYGLERKMTGPGTNAAKSLTGEQMGVLKSIRDDLLRQNNLNAGKSAGATTFQNIATDNIIGTLLPGKVGAAVTGKAGGLLGQVGKLAYSGPNEAIRSKLLDSMLNPELAQPAFNPLLTQPSRLNQLANQVGPYAARSAPVLSSDR